MHYRFVSHLLGLLLIALALPMFILAFFSAFEQAALTAAASKTGFTIGGFIALTLGALLTAGKPWKLPRSAHERKEQKRPQLGRREAFLIVAASWIIGSIIAAIPFLTWGTFMPKTAATSNLSNFVNAWFEATSGLTTTGATVITDISELPNTLLFWRSLTHWLGGIGIVLLFVAILPSLGIGAKRLFRIEAPGPSPEAVKTKIKDTAKTLLFIYVGLTLTAALLYKASGAMNWIEACCHAMSVVSTGGFSTENGSIAAFQSTTINWITIVFMILAGINFTIYYLVAQGKWKIAWKDPELQTYLFLKVSAAIIIAWCIYGSTFQTTAGENLSGTLEESITHAAFTTIALQTGTGFVNANYSDWGWIPSCLLIGLMFLGGCAGSTAGGLKIIRFWIVLKAAFLEIEKTFRPNVIRPLKIGTNIVSKEAVFSIAFFTFTFLGCLIAGAFTITFFENGNIDFLTGLTASLCTLGNVGPGFNGIGPDATYAWLSNSSKVIMIFLMVLGRLEIFTVLVLLSPRFWTGN